MRRALAILLACLVTAAGSPAYAQPDMVRGLQWQIAKLKLDEVHPRSTGAGIVVAVVDSGVDARHPDLVGQVLQGPDVRASTDVDGRGTGLAGLIAGHGHSASGSSFVDSGDAGILGVAPGAKILPVAFAPTVGETGSPDELATGVELAVNRGAKIICIGRGVPSSERLQFAIDIAFEKNVLVIAADSSTWPASYPGVLTAIPADRTGEVRIPPATGRSTGIIVPGYELMTTDRSAGYRFTDSSASAAVLAGAAALVWSANPDAKASEIMNLLRATATDRGPAGPDSQFGVGDVDILKALRTGLPAPKPSATTSGAQPSVKAPGLGAHPMRPLVDSTDWSRWVVVLPLLLFLIAVGFWSARAARR